MMDHSQSVPAAVNRRSEHELFEAMFAALAAASSFVHIGSATSAKPTAQRAPRRRPDSRRAREHAPFDPELHIVLPFRGWVTH